MIDLYKGKLLDVINANWRSDDADALSYALQWCMQTIIDMARRTRLRGNLDDVSERALDILAAEMRVPYYTELLPLDSKRELVRHALLWHMHAGTPSAVEELIRVVFGSGEVVEWWDFGDYPEHPQPYTFDIKTVAPLQPDTRAQLLEMIGRVKNTRSHLRNLRYERKPARVMPIGHSSLVIRRHHTDGGPMDVARYTSGHLTAISALTIPRRRTAAVRRETRTTSAALTMSAQVIRRRIIQ